MYRCVKISDARARLFDLVDEVIGGPEGVVLIEHRDRPERAALIGERYLRYLQRTISELRREAGHTFRLSGSVIRPGSKVEEVEETGDLEDRLADRALVESGPWPS